MYADFLYVTVVWATLSVKRFSSAFIDIMQIYRGNPQSSQISRGPIFALFRQI